MIVARIFWFTLRLLRDILADRSDRASTYGRLGLWSCECRHLRVAIMGAYG